MSDLPERVWIDGGIAQNSWQDSPDNCVSPHGPYIHHDHAQALVAAAYEAAADQVFKQHPTECQASIRTLTPSDAQAALDAAIERAVREERERCARIANTEGVGDTTNVNAYWFRHARRIAAAIRKDTE